MIGAAFGWIGSTGWSEKSSGALPFLGLMSHEDELQEARTKAEAFLEAGVAPDHLWLHLFCV